MNNSTVRLLGEIGRLRTRAAASGRLSPAEVAGAFGWNADAVRQREISLGDTRLDIARGFFGTQPAALFATPIHRNGVDPVDGAALYGYHAAVRWGLLVDQKGLTPFNSHWLMRDRWFVLPTILWEDAEGESSFLSAFEPEKLATGEPDRIALSRYPSPSFLQPVDDELVDCLDAWRDEALKSAIAQSGVDEELQTLFAKLFVLRAIEDRGLAPSVPPLSSTINSRRELDRRILLSIFEKASLYIGSDLFSNLTMEILPAHVIAGIIADLYHPRKLPASARYNFAWIDSDVLGLAYEKYLSTILQPLPLSPQLDLFRTSYRDVARVSVRRAGGVYYTPPYLTNYLANRCIDEFNNSNNLNEIPKIIDFSCGSGSFLVAAVDRLLGDLKRRDDRINWGRELIEGGYINGVDIDEKAVTVARLNIWNRLSEEPDPLPLPSLSRVIVKGDALDDTSWNAAGRRFDIVLGNPPYLATARVLNREALESNFETAKGRYDYSSLFVEQAIRLTAPSGTIGMVIPNRMFRNQHAESIRSFVTSNMDINTIVDFGSNEVFQNTSAYVGCLVATHRTRDLLPAQSVCVMEVKSLPQQFVAALLFDGETGLIRETNELRVYTAQHPRGGAPWILLSEEEKRQQVQLSANSVRLDSISAIFQGIRTGANDVFIVQISSKDDKLGAEIVNGLGDSAIVEAELLQPVVFGVEVRKYRIVSYNKYLIYPYSNGVAILEAELQIKYPKMFRYLSEYRDILSARASITASGLRWYELVRRRDEEWLRRPKLLIRDLAPETSFAVDAEGAVFIVGGTAIIPEQDDMLFPLLAYLNSRHVNALVRRLTPQFRGNFQKFEPQHLQGIPVITRLVEDSAFATRLAELARSAVTRTGETQGEVLAEIEAAIESAMAAAGVSVER